MKIVILHGVNLNMFGKRDPKYYGSITLEDINMAMKQLSWDIGVELEFYQTNRESLFIEKIHKLVTSSADAVVINAGAWTHYSYALMDALAILTIPIVEVHMSNIFSREEFRAKSVISPIAWGVISGFGVDSYLLGLRAAYNLVTARQLRGEV